MGDIFDKVLSVSGLYEKVFGKLLPDLVYNQVSERQKQLLVEVFGFRDVNAIFKKELLKGDTIDLVKIVFKYTDGSQQSIIKTPKND